MKIRKEYIILSLIILVSVIYIVGQKDSKINYEVPRFEVLKKADIQKIIMKNNLTTLELKKEGDSWIILPEGYKADSSQINRLLSESASLTIMDLISDRENYDRYNLDEENAQTVSIFDKEGLRREFLLGKTASGGVYSYISIKETSGVYSVSGDLKSIFDLNRDKMRDKQVLSFAPGSIKEMEILKDKTRSLLKLKGEGEESVWTLDGNDLDNTTEIKNRVETLSRLKCTGFIESQNMDPLVTIRLIGEEIYTVDLFEKQEKGYTAVSSLSQDPFLIPIYLGDDLVDFF